MSTSALSRLLLAAGLAAAAISPVALAQRGGGGRPDTPSGPPGITLYSDTNLRGNAVELTGDQPNFNTIHFNDQARSIEVRGGVWMVCADGNYKGRCEYIDRTVRNLGEIGLSGAISSAKRLPYDKGPRSYDIALFADGNYGGAFVGFDEGVADLSQYRFNDAASSIMINRGTWLVCEHADYRGQCELLEASTGNLASLGLNDKITSFRRYDVRREGPWRRPIPPVTGPVQDTRGGFRGEQTVFFPTPTTNGRRINDGSGAATRFCQSMGFYEAVYKAPGPVLSDVVCR
ncbi:beta/gamma crystallin-related protein [Hyphomonas sp.]|uniref:beta/gamma crystallin-related protein n=1 Tax=Hyphomonas sp. TaxID=87 RepID=UPI0025C2C6C5|nr:beta/gamma crystallin-related protein [Hyphomonas sp.]